jgi:hypothetical protein
MSLPADVLAALEAFAAAHSEVLAEAEHEAQAAAEVVAPRAYDFFEVIRELARRTGLIGGADQHMSAKAEAAIAAHQAAYPAPDPAAGEPDPAPGPVPAQSYQEA